MRRLARFDSRCDRADVSYRERVRVCCITLSARRSRLWNNILLLSQACDDDVVPVTTRSDDGSNNLSLGHFRRTFVVVIVVVRFLFVDVLALGMLVLDERFVVVLVLERFIAVQCG